MKILLIMLAIIIMIVIIKHGTEKRKSVIYTPMRKSSKTG